MKKAARMEDGVLDLIAVHVSTDLLALSVKEVKEINKEENYRWLYAAMCIYVFYTVYLPAEPVSFQQEIYYLYFYKVFLYGPVATLRVGKAVSVVRN